MLPLKCAGTKPPSYGLSLPQTNLFGKPMFSIYIRACLFLSIFTGSLIYEHYTRECEFGNFDKIKNTKHKKTKQHKKTQKLLAEFLFK